MQETTFHIPHNARTAYTAVKNLFRKRTGFSAVECNDDLFTVEARHGAWISPFTEKIKIQITATSSQECDVNVKSTSRSILNLLNFGANKDNLAALKSYISNEAYKLMQPGDIPMTRQENHSEIRIVPPHIKFRE